MLWLSLNNVHLMAKTFLTTIHNLLFIFAIAVSFISMTTMVASKVFLNLEFANRETILNVSVSVFNYFSQYFRLQNVFLLFLIESTQV